MDRFWNRFGKVVARVGLTPNMVTVSGIVLCAINAAAFPWHQSFLLFGVFVALIELLDNVDGAVARVTGTSSLYGSYLDAVTDRYKDFFILLSIAWVTGYWSVCTIAIAGSMITSYNASRADALGFKDEPKSDSAGRGFPDLFERLERIAMISLGLILTPLLAPDLVFGHDLLWGTLWVVAIGTHLTAIQRFIRRGAQIKASERSV